MRPSWPITPTNFGISEASTITSQNNRDEVNAVDPKKVEMRTCHRCHTKGYIALDWKSKTKLSEEKKQESDNESFALSVNHNEDFNDDEPQEESTYAVWSSWIEWVRKVLYRKSEFNWWKGGQTYVNAHRLVPMVLQNRTIILRAFTCTYLSLARAHISWDSIIHIPLICCLSTKTYASVYLLESLLPKRGLKIRIMSRPHLYEGIYSHEHIRMFITIP